MMDIKSISIKNILFYLAPIIAVLIYIFQPLNTSSEANALFSVALLMAIWWATEKIPLAVTALLPIVLFPLFGIMDGKDVSSTYYNHIIFLFIGGFILALGMQRWDLHKRIAIKILMITGTSPAKILLGFMLATAFLSMWISNTATTMMMLPILLSVVSRLEEMYDKAKVKKYAIGLLLGVAYSSSVGGVATLIGTPPNPIFVKIYNINFPQAAEISFSQWMLFALPLSIVMFVLLYLLLYIAFAHKQSKDWKSSSNTVDFSSDYKKLGKATYEEKWMFFMFILAALLWMLRSPLNIGNFHFSGWASLLPYPKYINDGTVAIFIAISLFLIPTKSKSQATLINWIQVKELPWNIILLFGGGFALAQGFKTSGLSEFIGESLSAAGSLHPLVLIIVVTTIMVFLTEFSSNSASTTILLPILASLAVSSNIHPLMLMVPATIAASMAFMLPVATPPNAIIFSSNRIRIVDMMSIGIIVNIIAILVISVITYYWLPFVFEL
ncbi:MAG: SLC13/DASS family transporter [Bacteroidales bacterium]|nr:SLC13/DASS family transporter [Bacteroidales bacterium]